MNTKQLSGKIKNEHKHVAIVRIRFDKTANRETKITTNVWQTKKKTTNLELHVWTKQYQCCFYSYAFDCLYVVCRLVFVF